ARLQHPSIVQIYDVGLAGGQPYLALEYVEGGSLSRRIDGTPQPSRQAAELVETLARAIHVAHEHGILHRDLKPANTLLRRKSESRLPKSKTEAAGSDFGFRISDFEFKVTDFGLAKIVDRGVDLTRSRDILGTPNYMAPEQAQGRVRDIGP